MCLNLNFKNQKMRNKTFMNCLCYQKRKIIYYIHKFFMLKNKKTCYNGLKKNKWLHKMRRKNEHNIKESMKTCARR